MSCFNPNISTVCEKECEKGKNGFFVSPDNEIFNYDFSSLGKGGTWVGAGYSSNGEENTIKGFNNRTYNNKTGETKNNDDNVDIEDTDDHVDLCHYKQATEIDHHKNKITSTFLPSPGEMVIWLIVLFIMGVTWNSFENQLPFKNSFFKKNVNGKMLGGFYVFLCSVIMITIRKLTQTRTVEGYNVQSIKAYLEDFLPYSVVCIGAYVFFSGFLRIKGSESKISGGGIGDSMNININKLTIYIGIVLMIINSFGISYLYLKQKARSRKDQYSRSLYWSQISVMIMGCLTALFVCGFTWDNFTWASKSGIVDIFKWVLLILTTVFLIHGINRITRNPHHWLQVEEELKSKEDWFGNGTTAEKAFAESKSDEVALKAYARDNDYKIPAGGVNSDEIKNWKIKAYENVYGKCYERDAEDTSQCGESSDKVVGNCYKVGKRCTNLSEGAEVCSSLDGEDTCNNNELCSWNAGASCSGEGSDGAQCVLNDQGNGCNGGENCKLVEGTCSPRGE